LIKKVGPVEGGLEDLGRCDSQVFDDILLYLGGGRGSKGYDGDSIPQSAYDRFDVAVFRSEIVAPFGDAVGLVHGHKGEGDLSEELDIVLLGQGFRGHVQ